MKNQIQKNFSFTIFKENLITHWEMATKHGMVFVLLAFILGSVALITTNNYTLLRMFQFLSFIGLGLLHIHYLKILSFLNRHFFQEELYYTVLLSFVICIALLLLYSFSEQQLQMAYASVCAFLLPFTIRSAWLWFRNIPAKEYRIWYNTERIEPDIIGTMFQRNIPVLLKINRKYFDIEETIFPVSVPWKIKLGRAFSQFLLDQNKSEAPSIESLDKNKKSFGWEFYIEILGGWFKKRLDPELTVADNHIKENSTILIRRVQPAIKTDNLEQTKFPDMLLPDFSAEKKN